MPDVGTLPPMNTVAPVLPELQAQEENQQAPEEARECIDYIGGYKPAVLQFPISGPDAQCASAACVIPIRMPDGHRIKTNYDDMLRHIDSNPACLSGYQFSDDELAVAFRLRSFKKLLAPDAAAIRAASRSASRSVSRSQSRASSITSRASIPASTATPSATIRTSSRRAAGARGSPTTPTASGVLGSPRRQPASALPAPRDRATSIPSSTSEGGQQKEQD